MTIMESMEVSKDERALIRAIRKCNEVTANVVLWYVSGLEEAAKKVEGHNAYHAELSRARATAMRIEYNKNLKEERY